MDNNLVRFVVRQAGAAVLGAISTAVVFGTVLAIQNFGMGGVHYGVLFLFLGWGLSWVWWLQMFDYFDIFGPVEPEPEP